MPRYRYEAQQSTYRKRGPLSCTGTPVGDPIEVSAVASFLCNNSANRSSQNPLLIGSAKPSFGHSEAASGITSIIKATLALENLQIPATVGIKRLNPKIPWDDYHVQVARSLVPWPQSRSAHQTVRASINSFGYGGANAHCILERAEGYYRSYSSLDSDANRCASDYGDNHINGNINGKHSDLPDVSRNLINTAEKRFVLPISAKSSESFKGRAQDLTDMNLGQFNIRDLAYTLGERRTEMAWRGFVLAKKETLSSDVVASAFEQTMRRSEGSALPITFVFTGQGAQWPQMGKELFERHQVFRSTILNLENHLSKLDQRSAWSLSQALFEGPETSNIHRPSVSQTACTAIQVALVDLLREWGIVPQFVVGHSSGEIAASYAAGHLSARCAIEIAYYRGLVVSTGTQDGAMMAVGMSQEEASRFIEVNGVSKSVCIACVNSPESVTLSGDADAVDSLLPLLQQRRTFARKLKTGGLAYHSHHMQRLGKIYEDYLGSVMDNELLQPPEDSVKEGSTNNKVTMISSMLNRPVNQVETRRPVYWRYNLESPVLFRSAIETLLKINEVQFVEIGPHAALGMAVKQTQQSVENNLDSCPPYLSALKRNSDSECTVLTLIGVLWSLGHQIAFDKVNDTVAEFTSKRPKVLHDLPNYRWNHTELLWTESRASSEYRQQKFPHDDLLGALIPGSNGHTSTWRNLLNIGQVPWVNDHKLGDDVVLPGACYIAMASRACQQLMTESSDDLVMMIRDLHIEKVLTLNSKTRDEIFTELVPRKLTDVSEYDSWWQFNISSFVDGRTTRHARGNIGFVQPSNIVDVPAPILTDELEEQDSSIWYSSLLEAGLRFDPFFQSLDKVLTPRMKTVMFSQVRLAKLPGDVIDEHHHLYRYEIHPIVIDSQLQAGLISISSGDLAQVSAKVPVFIEKIQIHPNLDDSCLSQCLVRASAKSTGFGTAVAQAELLFHNGNPAMQMANIKVAPLKSASHSGFSRHPLLRVVWHPDVSNIRADNHSALSKCLSKHISTPIAFPAEGLAKILRLLSYRKGELKVAQIGEYLRSVTTLLRNSLDCGTAFQRVTAWHMVTSTSEGELQFHDLSASEPPDDLTSLRDHRVASEHVYDVIICPQAKDATASIQTSRALILNNLDSDGKLLFDGEVDSSLLASLGLQGLELPLSDIESSITLAFRVGSENNLDVHDSWTWVQSPDILLIVKDESHPLNQALLQRLKKDSWNVSIVNFDEMDPTIVDPGSSIIVTAELEEAIMIQPSRDQLSVVTKATSKASMVVWVSGGSLIASKRPEFSAAFAFSRSVMAENPTTKFIVVDLDSTREDLDLTIPNLVTVLARSSTMGSDLEYLQKEGILHISRIVPDIAANDIFRAKKTQEPKATALKLAGRAELSIRELGQFDTLEYVQVPDLAEVPEDSVEVLVKAAGLNAKDLYTLSGKIETVNGTCSCEFAGVVTRVGSSVTSFAVGDRIVSSAPGRFGTSECVPAWACCKLQDSEEFVDMATVPVVFATAVHALKNVARLEAGESILIHSAAGGVGSAAIQFAKQIGAEIYATVGQERKKAYLIKQFGLDPSRIFNSHDISFLAGIMNATQNRGVDVVLNSLVGEKLHASLEACAKFGRFVEIGKRDLLDGGNLSMSVFLRGITLSAFDLHELYYSKSELHQQRYGKLLTEGIEFFRRVRPSHTSPTKVFDVSNVGDAFRFFANASRVGKVALSFGNPASILPLVQRKYTAKFSPNKSYLMVGCLGGLGRSISRYLLANGARYFSFLSRSASDKIAARQLVEDLERHGAAVDVIRGDVQDFGAVKMAVDRMPRPLGGVIHAAMSLSEVLFHDMTKERWDAVLGPKVQGTWNIHHAIAGNEQELDFFLMTSSVGGTIGFPTESNYSTANGFLDHFASYRRSLGLPAVSIAFGPISGVGYVHEHSGVGEIFFRQGITAISEEDALQTIDIALAYKSRSDVTQGPTDSHFLTGLEPALAKTGYESSFDVMAPDPRLSILNLSRSHLQKESSMNSTANGGLPSPVAQALASNSKETLRGTIIPILAEQLAHLVFMPPERISPQMHLLDIGMDSTLAAQYRTLIFRVLSVEVPFITLMDPKLKLLDIADWICEKLLVLDPSDSPRPSGSTGMAK